MQMAFYCDLYFSEELKHKKEKVIQKLNTNSAQPSIYIITLAQGMQNHQHFYEDTPLFVVGIARGYDGALYLTEHIVKEIYEKAQDTDIRSFIVNRQKEYEEGRV